MKSEKRQTLIMIGISLLVIAGVFVCIALKQPPVYVDYSDEQSYSEAYSKTENDNAAKIPSSEIIVNYPLNINTATLEELMTIDGLGEKRASAIIEYRNYLGKYTSVEQIMEIEGFGEEIYKQIAGYLTV